MPIYCYRCQNCSETHEALQRVSDAPLSECPHCGEPQLRRVIAPVGIVFKGSGWHVTDYRSGSSKSASGGDSSDSKGDSKATESKSDAKTADTAKSDSGTSKVA
ncbi:MAG: FmdB family zinc ribbon protein [Candidatus Eremiobacterota bacterium]